MACRRLIKLLQKNYQMLIYVIKNSKILVITRISHGKTKLKPEKNSPIF
jgi:hypothetical protein